MSNITSVAEVIIVPVVISLITAASGIVAILVSNNKQHRRAKKDSDLFREENTAQHNENRGVSDQSVILLTHLSAQVTGIDEKVDKLDDRLDQSNMWQSNHELVHLKKEMNDETP